MMFDKAYFYNQLMQGCENAPDFFSLQSEVVIQFQKILEHSDCSADSKLEWFENLYGAYIEIVEQETGCSENDVEDYDVSI